MNNLVDILILILLYLLHVQQHKYNTTASRLVLHTTFYKIKTFIKLMVYNIIHCIDLCIVVYDFI